MDRLNVTGLHKVYGGTVQTTALTDVNFSVKEGEFVGVMGQSGSGKTTLLNIISTIDEPSGGQVSINGQNPHHMKKNELALFRRREIGFVFQQFHLLHTLTVAENIVLPLTLDKRKQNEMETLLKGVTSKLGIEHILDKRTYEISGGQCQRVAIARAIIHSPSLLLADEPTGSLDSASAKAVMEAFHNLHEQDGATIVLVTHDPLAASYCNRIVFMKDGKIAGEIHKGENRQAFFQRILDMLSFWGGDAHEFSSVRL